jgi:hypothetical protein
MVLLIYITYGYVCIFFSSSQYIENLETGFNAHCPRLDFKAFAKVCTIITEVISFDLLSSGKRLQSKILYPGTKSRKLLSSDILVHF